MAAKDRTLPDAVRDAAVNLRVSGLSERSVYEHFRDILAVVPSYRDLRATWADAGVRYRGEAAVARRQGRYVGAKPPVRSEYAERKALALAVDQTPTASESFDRRYVYGYLGREAISPDDIEGGFQETFFLIEHEHRSP